MCIFLRILLVQDILIILHILFSPKGALKMLRETFQYNSDTGIFDKHKLYYSSVELAK